MNNLNENLPDNLKRLIDFLSIEQAVPLGKMSDLPFIALKVDSDEEVIEQGNIVSELKASILNIDFDQQTVGICFVQLRLNGTDKFIYTATYDLNNEKQYADCYELLGMAAYGLFVATDKIHDFLVFDSEFEADFRPRSVLEYAKEQSSDYPPELFAEVSYGLRTQAQNPRSFWDYLDVLAPFDKRWYGRMTINKA